MSRHKFSANRQEENEGKGMTLLQQLQCNVTIVRASGALKCSEDHAPHAAQSVVHNSELYLELCLALAKLNHHNQYCEGDKGWLIR
jgi:hypothetical protein